MLTKTKPDAAEKMVTDTLGRPLHDLRISVIDRCNFRCPYCMPEEQYPEHYEFVSSPERLSFEEIQRLTALFARLGVKKLRVTGGEPLLRKNLPVLIRSLADTDGIEDIALTTNGVLLASQAEALKAAGLERVTISLDSIDPQVFATMSGDRGDSTNVLKGVDAARDAGLSPIKINVVVQKGVNDHTVTELLEKFRGTGVIVRFIEYMDVGNRNHWRINEVVPSSELLERINARWPVKPLDENYPGEVASRYEFEDGSGEIGFISSVTNPFCRSCTRARLSTNGVLYTCLFASHGTDLRGPMRDGVTDDDLFALIQSVWRGRADRYSELREPTLAEKHLVPKIEMYQIGG